MEPFYVQATDGPDRVTVRIAGEVDIASAALVGEASARALAVRLRCCRGLLAGHVHRPHWPDGPGRGSRPGPQVPCRLPPGLGARARAAKAGALGCNIAAHPDREGKDADGATKKAARIPITDAHQGRSWFRIHHIRVCEGGAGP